MWTILIALFFQQLILVQTSRYPPLNAISQILFSKPLSKEAFSRLSLEDVKKIAMTIEEHIPTKIDDLCLTNPAGPDNITMSGPLTAAYTGQSIGGDRMVVANGYYSNLNGVRARFFCTDEYDQEMQLAYSKIQYFEVTIGECPPNRNNRDACISIGLTGPGLALRRRDRKSVV